MLMMKRERTLSSKRLDFHRRTRSLQPNEAHARQTPTEHVRKNGHVKKRELR